MALVIGVAGGTGAGKSAIVRALVDRVGARAIDLDSYYLDRSGLTPAERDRVNYDEPAAIDVELLADHLGRLTRGESADKPVYSFATHTRRGIEPIAPARLVIVEGLFTLWWPALRSLLDLKIFVESPADLRLIRRIRRDMTERGRTLEHVLQQHLTTVHPMHERYVEPTRAYADVVVANDGLMEDAVERVLAAIRRRTAGGLAATAPERQPS